MVIAVSLITAALFGTGDFLGGLAAKRMTIAQVVFGSHFVGLVGVVLASLVLTNEFRLDDFGLGAVGGLFGGAGVALLYRRLAIGPMHVVAPLTAITSAVVPTVWGLVVGERLSILTWFGIALGLVAIGLISAVRTSSDLDPDSAARSDHAGHGSITPAVVIESLLSGCGFGAFFIFLDATDAASAPWPVAGARLATSVLLLLFLGTRATAVRPPKGFPTLLVIATGAFDTVSNVGFLYATNRGDLAVVSVLTSLYPMATVILAWVVLKERLSGSQGVGVAGAMAATAMIALG